MPAAPPRAEEMKKVKAMMPLDVDAQQHGRPFVLSHGADGLAGPAALEEEGQDHHKQGGDENDPDLQGGDGHPGNLPDVHLDRAGRKAHRARPEQAEGRGVENDRHGDAGDQPGEVAVGPPAQGREGRRVDQKAEQPGQQGGQGEGQPDGHPGGLNQPHGAQAAERKDGGVGQVQDVQNAEYQGVPHGKQPVDAADEQPIDQLLREQVHPGAPVYLTNTLNLPSLTSRTTGVWSASRPSVKENLPRGVSMPLILSMPSRMALRPSAVPATLAA